MKIEKEKEEEKEVEVEMESDWNGKNDFDRSDASGWH